jgi:uncharacterized membrane protein YkgB
MGEVSMFNILLLVFPPISGIVSLIVGLIIGFAIWHNWLKSRGWAMLILAAVLAAISYLTTGPDTWLIGLRDVENGPVERGVLLQSVLVGLFLGVFLALVYRRIRPVKVISKTPATASNK